MRDIASSLRHQMNQDWIMEGSSEERKYKFDLRAQSQDLEAQFVVVPTHGSTNLPSATWKLGEPRFQSSPFGFGNSRDVCGKWVNSQQVQYFMVLLIFVNAITLGVLTSKAVVENPPIRQTLEVLDKTFLTLSTLEILMQLFYLGFSLAEHSWLVFDLLIISISWIFMGSATSVLRSFRVFRLLSIVRKLKPMRLLVEDMMKALPHVVFLWAILLLLFYSFGVMCTTLYGNLFNGEDTKNPYDFTGSFSSLTYSSIFLLKMACWTTTILEVWINRFSLFCK
jgi:Ion transport protein